MDWVGDAEDIIEERPRVSSIPSQRQEECSGLSLNSSMCMEEGPSEKVEQVKVETGVGPNCNYIVELPPEESMSEHSLAVVEVKAVPYEEFLTQRMEKVCLKRRLEDDVYQCISKKQKKSFSVDAIPVPELTIFKEGVDLSPNKVGKGGRGGRQQNSVRRVRRKKPIPMMIEDLVDVPVGLVSQSCEGGGSVLTPEMSLGGGPKTATGSP
ncbi:uncharacterized protein G2W53_014015 [Senna tora]|uniref:Uncharacterized protein n=1 Tax=Senna tora TaxID=362788 RepID=A0A834WR59_9FABA|nr:uncharacterized protein G2W53_014015 [Senna tora]